MTQLLHVQFTMYVAIDFFLVKILQLMWPSSLKLRDRKVEHREIE